MEKELQVEQQLNSESPRYYCGRCSTEFTRASTIKETPRCPECGYRIIYKCRTRKTITYKAS